MNDYTKNLPCLQSVGPWWSEKDRRLLFCYLLKIFPFDADFLSASDAAAYIIDGTEHRISSIEIKNDFESFMKKRKSVICTCTALKRCTFSFGKLNTNICHLCPYSNSYTNHFIADECRFISYVIKFDPLQLSGINAKLAAGSTEAFVSQVPIYIDKYLIDTFPMTIIVEPFINGHSNFETKSTEEFFQHVREEIRSGTSKRISYLRLKHAIADYYPDYQELVLSSAYLFFEDIINDCHSIRSVAPNSVRNLYNIFSTSCNKKHNKKPSSFYDEEQSAVSRKIFVLHTIDEEEGKVEIVEADELFPLSNNQNELDMEQVDPLTELLDVDYQALPSLEDHLLQPESDMSSYSLPDLPVDSKIKVQSFRESFDNSPISVSNKDIVAPEELAFFQEFYPITEYENIFIYGNGEIQSDNGILTAFTTNCTYLCAEVVKTENYLALLLINHIGEQLLYPLDLFGPKFVRNIANLRIPVYSSNRYFLSLYLFRNKVYKLNILDVGLAYSLMHNTPACGISTFQRGGLINSMNSYPELYEKCSAYIGENGRMQLKRFEDYSSLLCGDGENAPFRDMPRLYKSFALTNFQYSFDGTCIPIREGVFMQIRVTHINFDITEYELIQIYMDACIALNTKCPFCEGLVHILKMNKDGILFYITGNIHRRRTTQLYLSSSIRRAFSMVSTFEEAINIEEQFLDYSPKTNLDCEK